MDEFIVQIENNISGISVVDKKVGKFRNLLYNIISAVPDINNIKKRYKVDSNGEYILDKNKKKIWEGDIKFEVSIKQMGISFETLVKYRNEICSTFVINFMGELIVRENINRFGKILTSMKADQYSVVVNNFVHKKFGMKIVKDCLIFTFHISLLQDILTEDFKKEIR